MPVPEPGEASPRSAAPLPADTLVIAQLVLQEQVARGPGDPGQAQLTALADSLLHQQLSTRTELLVVVHAVPGDSAALERVAADPHRVLPASSRLLVAEDEDLSKRGALLPLLTDVDSRPYRRVIRLRLESDEQPLPRTVAQACDLARAARHDAVGSGKRPLELATALLRQPITVLDAPETFSDLDAWPGTEIHSRTGHVLAAAAAGGIALHTVADAGTGVREFRAVALEVELTVERHGETLLVDCDLSSLGTTADPTICYYVVQNGTRLAMRWYAPETTATFEGIPVGVTVRGFIRAHGTDIARAESGVL